MALARRSAGGGSSWAGMQWKVRDDTSADGLREFSIEKGAQVLYVEFSCFSDVA
jgi:hypothetical protein